jgi:hypothetical protein
VKRTAEFLSARYLLFPVVRFTDFVSHSFHRSDESLGYFSRPANADSTETLLYKASILSKRIVGITVKPTLARLCRCNHRMATGVRMLSGMAVN